MTKLFWFSLQVGWVTMISFLLLLLSFMGPMAIDRASFSREIFRRKLSGSFMRIIWTEWICHGFFIASIRYSGQAFLEILENGPHWRSREWMPFRLSLIFSDGPHRFHSRELILHIHCLHWAMNLIWDKPNLNQSTRGSNLSRERPSIKPLHSRHDRSINYERGTISAKTKLIKMVNSPWSVIINV